MRLSEHYVSVQGEGPGAGLMTQFIRFGGCNLRCPGWPCDTPYAVDPAQYRHEWVNHTPQAIMDTLFDYPQRVVLTGGEPLLQNKEELATLTTLLRRKSFGIELFTNGTMPLPMWVHRPKATTIMDWKLPGSGEDPFNKTRIANLRLLTCNDAVKFVIADANDFEAAINLHEAHIKSQQRFEATPQVYYGVAWGKMENAELIEWVRGAQLDWKLNVQVHNYIWDRSQRGI